MPHDDTIDTDMSNRHNMYPIPLLHSPRIRYMVLRSLSSCIRQWHMISRSMTGRWMSLGSVASATCCVPGCSNQSIPNVIVVCQECLARPSKALRKWRKMAGGLTKTWLC